MPHPPRLTQRSGLIILLLLVAGCSGRSLLTPDSAPAPTGGYTDWVTTNELLATGTGALGAYEFQINPEALTGTLTPITAERSGQLGETLTVDSTGFLAGAFCPDCFRIDSVGRAPGGQLYVDYSVRHPFALPTLPSPGPEDRLDLHVFDLRAVFLHGGVQSGTESSFAALAAAKPVGLSGPQNLSIDNSGFLAGITIDGHTGAFDNYTDNLFPTPHTLHPYVILSEDTRTATWRSDVNNGTTNIREPQGNNVFAMGSGPHVRRVIYAATPGGDPITGAIFLFANLGVSAQGKGLSLGQRMNPVYFVPEFNMKEPWRVSATETANTLEEGNPTSAATFQIEVYDWQHAQGTSPIVPSLGTDLAIPRNALLQPSRVTALRAEVPGVATPLQISTIFAGGDGKPDTPMHWELTIPNAGGAVEGSYLGLVEISDEYIPTGGLPGGRGQDAITPFALGRASTFAALPMYVGPPIPPGDPPGTYGEGSSSMWPSGAPGSALPNVGYSSKGQGQFVATSNGLGARYLIGTLPASGGSLLNLSGTDILALVTSTGGANWSNPRVINTGLLGLGDQTNPAVTVGNGAEVFAVYESPRIDPSTHDIYCQMSPDRGFTWSSAVQVSLSGGDDTSTDPSIAVLGSGRVIVAYIYDSGDKIAWSASTNGGSSWSSPALYDPPKPVRSVQLLRMPPAISSDGFTMVHWQDPKNDREDIVSSHYSSGSTLWNRIGIYSEPSGQGSSEPHAAYRESDGTLYVTYLTGPSTALKPAISSKPYGATSYGAPRILDSAPTVTYGAPTLAVKDSGEILVVWSDTRDQVLGRELQLARSSNAGVDWKPLEQILPKGGDQRWPTVVFDRPAQRTYVMYWQDSGTQNGANLQYLIENLDP